MAIFTNIISLVNVLVLPQSRSLFAIKWYFILHLFDILNYINYIWIIIKPPAMFKLLDLYCKAGGAGEGYKQAGFDVTGVDIVPQPNNPHRFVLGDAIEYLIAHGHEYDVIHASPPCQAYSKSTMQFRIAGKVYPDLVSATRDALVDSEKPFVIENVPDAPLVNPITLCGAMFNLPTYRHRLFESNIPLSQPIHPAHVAKNARMGRFPQPGEFIQYVGHFPGVQYVRDFTGLQWMTQEELAESIPPQYSKFIGHQLMMYLMTNLKKSA